MAPRLIASVRAFVWLRWRLVRNRLVVAARRDPGNVFARWADVLVQLLAVLFLAPAVVGLFAATAIVGWKVAERDSSDDIFFNVVRLLLLVFFAGVTVLPLFTGQGEGPSIPTRLRLLPVAGGHLYLIRLASSLFDPWLLLALAPLAGLPVGLLAGGAIVGAGVAAVAGLVLAVAFTAFSGWVGDVVASLLADRRRREAITVAFFTLLIGVGILPLVGGRDGGPRPSPAAEPEAKPVLEPGSAAWIDPAGELYVRTLEGTLRRDPARLALGGAGLVAFAGLFVVAGRRQYLRRLGAAESLGRRRSGAKAKRPWTLHFPGATAGETAIAESLVRRLLRTPQGKLALVQPALLAAVLGLIAWRSEVAAWMHGREDLAGVGAAMLAFMTYLQLASNQLVLDGAGLSLLRLQPISTREEVRGRTLGWGLLLLVGALTALGTTLAFVGPTWGSLARAAGFLIATVALAVVAGPSFVALAALLPRRAELGKLTRNQPHPLAGLVAMLAAPVAIIAPALMVLAVPASWRAIGAPLALLVWLGGAIAAGRILEPLAAAIVERRRDAVAAVATRR